MPLDEVRLDLKKETIEELEALARAADESPRHPNSVESTEQKFARLTSAWKLQRGPVSSPTKLVMHPAYQCIIGMGPDAVPFLLRELERDLDLWFWALRAITEADPVPPSSRGHMKEMAEAWLKWGREHGYR